MKFNPYPFERLRELLAGLSPGATGDDLNLSIGEPGFSAPPRVLDALKREVSSIRFYPTLLPELVASQLGFIKYRFGLDLDSEQLVPSFGSRELLFNFPHFLCLSRRPKASRFVLAYPNPFYQVYEGARIATDSIPLYLPLLKENNFKPVLDSKRLASADVVILNFPNNPTGQILSLEELRCWVRLALEHDFILINDECYSEVYEGAAPPSLLEASYLEGNTDFKNIFVVNSLSKRLSAPGLRSGFIAGEASLLRSYRIFRSYIGLSLPLPLQRASIVAWEEEEYAAFIRGKFARNLALAREFFPTTTIFPYTFYLWLEVPALESSPLSYGEVFARELFKRSGIRVLPGAYLGREGVGAAFVRIALTKEAELMQPALSKVAALYKEGL